MSTDREQKQDLEIAEYNAEAAALEVALDAKLPQVVWHVYSAWELGGAQSMQKLTVVSRVKVQGLHIAHMRDVPRGCKEITELALACMSSLLEQLITHPGHRKRGSGG